MNSRRFLLTAMCALAPVHAFAQDCLHGPNETPEQRTRRSEALGAARHLNTMQANRPNRGSAYLDLAELERLNADQAAKRPSLKSYNLSPDAEIVAGWRLTLSTTDTGYWFLITDTTDPCGFAYVSNERGIIYRAEPIR